jgi:hypothetical protein
MSSMTAHEGRDHIVKWLFEAFFGRIAATADLRLKLTSQVSLRLDGKAQQEGGLREHM